MGPGARCSWKCRSASLPGSRTGRTTNDAPWHLRCHHHRRGQRGHAGRVRPGPRGLRTLVLDGRASPGQGSNKAAIGGVRATHSDPAKIRLSLRSLDILSTWQAGLRRRHRVEHRRLRLRGLPRAGGEDPQDLLDDPKAYGLNIDWLDRQSCLELLPDLNPVDLLGGTYSPDDGHCSTAADSPRLLRPRRAARGGIPLRRAGDRPRPCRREGPRGDDATGALQRARASSTRRAPGPAQIGELAGLNAAGRARLARGRHHRAGGALPGTRWWWTSGPCPVRPTTTSTSTTPGRSSSASRPARASGAATRRETSEFLPMIAPRMVDLMPRLANIRVRRTWRGLYP